jgi:hypothetical protein
MKKEMFENRRAIGLALAGALALVGSAFAADVGPSAAAIASVDQSVRAFLAAHLTWAGQQLGLAVDGAGLAYETAPQRTLAGATVKGPRSIADIRAGVPFQLWYVHRRPGSSPPAYYTASLAPNGAAVLKDTRGNEVARGTAKLSLTTGPVGYCEFHHYPGSDAACLDCTDNFPDEWGGPINWSVCFTI